MKEIMFLREILDKKVKATLAENKDIIIETFVEFYGEKYRDTITKRYDKIVFCYYLSWKNVASLLSTVEDPELLKELNSYKDTYLKLTRDLKNAYGREEPHPMEAFIGITDESIIEEKNAEKNHYAILNAIVKNICLFLTKLNKDDQEVFLVILSVFTICEDFFLHEIGHAVVTEFLARKEYCSIKKVGLSVQVGSDERYLALEELVNEKTNVEIKEIFKRRGGNLSCFPNTGHLINIKYREYFYLVDAFYEEFKEIIKRTRITNNINYLVNRVGKENYERFVDLINECFLKSVSEERKQEVIIEIEELIARMKSNVIKYSDSDDLESYIKELESQGKRVRLLNQ